MRLTSSPSFMKEILKQEVFRIFDKNGANKMKEACEDRYYDRLLDDYLEGLFREPSEGD